MNNKLCPCGSKNDYENCCEIFVEGTKLAETPEQLMRSRYTAFVIGAYDHIRRTWHPDTLPELSDDEPNSWVGLEIVASSFEEDEGEVEFIAKLIFNNKLEIIHELSEFEKIDGAWLYVTGEFKNDGAKPKKIAKNEDCPCGSGLKFKKCCYK